MSCKEGTVITDKWRQTLVSFSYNLDRKVIHLIEWNYER